MNRAGFTLDRIIGSHHILVKGEVTVTVPVHTKQDVKPGTLRSVINQAGMTVDEFIGYL